MIPIEFTAEETEILQQVLKNYLASLEVEISHTDHAEFRQILKERRSLLRQTLARLAQVVAPA